MSRPPGRDVVIRVDDPRRRDIESLLRAHLTLMRGISPADHVHALDLDRLTAADVTFVSARSGDGLLGIGALRDLGGGRAEIKSMHTAEQARGQGVARRLLEYLLDMADERGFDWIGLETGTQPEFAPARALYASYNFAVCDPFDDYTLNPHSVCMSTGPNRDG